MALAACDFFVVHTITFRLLYCFVILGHGRRRILHFNVTAHPTAGWTSQQIVEAFPADGTAPRSPWQDPYCERVIGTLRRECLDHVIVLNEAHLRWMLSSFLDYYHASRPHQSSGSNAPTPRDIEPPSRGRVIGIPQVGGLHHRYSRAA